MSLGLHQNGCTSCTSYCDFVTYRVAFRQLTRANRAQELPEGSGLIFGFQVFNMDCLAEVFSWFCGCFQCLVWYVWFGFLWLQLNIGFCFSLIACLNMLAKFLLVSCGSWVISCVSRDFTGTFWHFLGLHLALPHVTWHLNGPQG
jgi:hypothetical protein